MARRFNFKNFLDNTKIIIEILAILSAGLWIFFNYIIKDSPSLYKTTDFKTKMTIDSFDKKQVLISFHTRILNTGRNPIKIDSCLLQYWILSIDSIKKEGFFSPGAYMAKNPSTFYQKDFSFSGLYPMEKEVGNTYNFFLPKDSVKALIVRIKYYGTKKTFWASESFATSNYAYKLHCVKDEKDNMEQSRNRR